MKLEVRFIPIESVMREERIISLRRLLMHGALQLAGSPQGVESEERGRPLVAPRLSVK